MKIKNIAKGAAKLAGITFAATAAIAIVTGGEALKTIGTGFQIAGEAVKKYVLPNRDEAAAEEAAETVAETTEEAAEETTEATETVEEDFEA